MVAATMQETGKMIVPQKKSARLVRAERSPSADQLKVLMLERGVALHAMATVVSDAEIYIGQCHVHQEERSALVERLRRIESEIITSHAEAEARVPSIAEAFAELQRADAAVVAAGGKPLPRHITKEEDPIDFEDDQFTEPELDAGDPLANSNAHHAMHFATIMPKEIGRAAEYIRTELAHLELERYGQGGIVIKVRNVAKVHTAAEPRPKLTKAQVQAARVDAFKKLSDITTEIYNLREEYDAISDLADTFDNPCREQYATRREAIEERQRALLPVLRAALVAFQLANIDAVAAGARSAWVFDQSRKSEQPESIQTDPLFVEGFDYEHDIDCHAEAYVEKLSEEFPEVK